MRRAGRDDNLQIRSTFENPENLIRNIKFCQVSNPDFNNDSLITISISRRRGLRNIVTLRGNFSSQIKNSKSLLLDS